MSVQSEINRITNAVASAYSAASEKGATMPATQNVSNLATCISSISGGGGGGTYPVFTYTGTYSFKDEGDGNWYVILEDAGTQTLRFSDVGNAANGIDVCVMGGGGSGGGGYDANSSTNAGHGGGGGGAGFVTNSIDGSIVPSNNVNYTVVIGAGGATALTGEAGKNGGQSSAFGITANGGNGGALLNNRNSTAQAAGGTGSADGGKGGVRRSSSSINTTATEGEDGVFAFGASSGLQLGGGGGGGYALGRTSSGNVWADGAQGGYPYGGYGGTANFQSGKDGMRFGAGGGGTRNGSGEGASGVVIFRNHRS